MSRPLKIAYLTAGAAGMICGSCLHDNTLARALIELGHDVQLVPLYHGVALVRAAAFGQGSVLVQLTHVAVLGAIALAGVAWGRVTLRRRLVD